MALDLSDEALGLPASKKSTVDLSDEALGIAAPAPTRAQFPTPGRTITAPFAPEIMALMEQAGSGLYSLATQAYSGLKGLYKGAIGAAAGLQFGEVFREEFNSAAENAADAYVPLTPEGEALTHKLGELVNTGIQKAGGFVFEKGLPLPPGPPAMLQQAGVIKGPGAGSPAVAAGTEAAVVGVTLLAPFGKGTPKPTTGKPKPPTWEEFAAKYPEAAKSVDASSLGAVRFRREDTSVADAVNRQVNTELGLSGAAAELPFRTRATMVFDKVAPGLPLGEKIRAVQALERKIAILDEARLDLSNRRGLPAPTIRPLEEPITVSDKGVALTAEQARELAHQFRTRSVEENADALGLSVIGQLKSQVKNVLKQEEGSPERNMEMSVLTRMWRQSFPDEYLGGRDIALEKFMNFQGDMTYRQVVEALGPPRSKRMKGGKQAGAIDIEGMEYLLNSFRDLPDQPVLKRSTIVGQLNRQGVPQAEKDVVLRALRDRDSITQPELVGSVAADILPLREKTIDLDNLYGVGNLQLTNGLPEVGGMVKGTTNTARVWQMPIKTEILNHFNDPQYFAHTRGFDRQSVRHIAEIQSDVTQRPRVDDIVGMPGETISGRLEELGGAAVGSRRDMERILPLQKRWYERVLMEENRQAAKDGIRVMRVATADTLAKVQQWRVREGIEPPLFITKEGYPIGRAQGMDSHGNMLNDRGLNNTPESAAKLGWFYVDSSGSKPLVIAGKELYRKADADSAAQELATSTKKSTILDFDGVRTEFTPKQVRMVPKENQGIYNVYKSEIASFTRARFGAKEVVDEFGHSWMEWPVRPEDASAKIPAFGGRQIPKEVKIGAEQEKYLDIFLRSGGPRGRQRGVIDIPEWEDVVRAKERGGVAAEQASTRGWTTPTPADDALYTKTRKAFDASRAAEIEGHKVTMESIAKRARREVVAHDYDLRVELERAGPYGQKAVDRLALQNGATMAAKSRMDAINENIFNNLDAATKQQVDELMRLRRIIEIDSYKGVGKHKHPEGITGPQAEAVAIRMKIELGDEQFSRVYDLTNRIMKEYKDILNRRHEAGLLSDDSYLKLLHFDYSPTEFIDLIDPLQTFTLHGRPITVRTSGVPFLERGKRGTVIMDSQLLLAEALVRSENLVFKNETMKQLHELASKAPNNGVVSLPAKNTIGKSGTPEAYMKHTPKGQVALGVRMQGSQEFVLMREDLAEQFIRRPQVMPEFVGTVARMASGTALIKATATTYNPAFIVAGLPMDILHTWLATSKHYSPHPPVFAGQMAADLAATAKDAWTKGPKYQQALREGLGSAFMTHEGRGFSGITERSMSVAERQMMPRFDKTKSWLSYFNESADIWVRMAHRERLIKQGFDSWQATGQARNRLDYSAGGELTRAADTIIPYTNVAVQALAKVAKAGARDPADLSVKLAWGGGAITAWTLANMISSPETWQQIPTSDKIRSLPITFGDQWYITDPDGNRRYVYAPGVRMDAVVAPIAATIIAGMEEAEYGRMPDGILTRSMSNLNPVMEFQAPPTIEAIKTYMSNYDALTGRPISPHFGKVKPEHEGTTMGRGEPPSVLARAIGGVTGMSPPRLDAASRKVINTNNLYLSMMGWGYKYIFEGSDPRIQSEATEQMVLRNPAIRPFVKLTNPSTHYMQQIDERREEEGSRRKQMTDSVDDLLFQVRKQQSSINDVKTYIKNQPPEDREWLTRYATTSFKVKEVMSRFGASEGIPNESWWRSVASLEPRPRAQEFYSQWLSADSEDRRRMERIAVGLHNAGAGFYSDSFRRELARERQLLGTEQR